MKFGIIGYGSFGRLLAEILSAHGEVFVYRRSEAGNENKNIKFVSFESAANADVVILAVPLDSMEDVCERLAGSVKPDTIVADVCSVKMKPIEIMNKYLAGKCRILAMHPLFGPKTVEAGSPKGKNSVICGEHPENYDKIVRFLKYKLQLNVVEMSAKDHDREMAWIHSLTFFVGQGLMKLELPKSNLTTGYYQKLLDLVELESSHSIELFNTVQRGNPFAADIRKKFLEELKQIDSELRNE